MTIRAKQSQFAAWAGTGTSWRDRGPGRSLSAVARNKANSRPEGVTAGASMRRNKANFEGRRGGEWDGSTARVGRLEFRVYAGRTGLTRLKAELGSQTRNFAFGDPLQTVPPGHSSCETKPIFGWPRGWTRDVTMQNKANSVNRETKANCC